MFEKVTGIVITKTEVFLSKFRRAESDSFGRENLNTKRSLQHNVKNFNNHAQITTSLY